MEEIKIIKNELQHIISGEGSGGKSDFVKTVQTHLRNSKKTSSETKNPELERTEEERALIDFAIEHGVLLSSKKFGTYIT